jgi:hypothetical protein
VRIDRPFWRAFGAWRFKYLVAFLFAGRVRLFLAELALLARTGRCAWPAALAFAGIGLHAARRRSRAAAWVAAGAVRARNWLRGRR